jgi:hypothetical protein
MNQRLIFLAVILIGTNFSAFGQKCNPSDSEILLKELGSMVKDIPDSKEKCQALIKKIQEWQKEKLQAMEKMKLRITRPTDKSKVTMRSAIEGIAPDVQTKVWVIVHPIETSEYWVQPKTTVKEDKAWKVMVYIGDTPDKGKEFEIMAVGNPKSSIKEADRLTDWPEGEWKSQVIEVTRK